MNAAYLMMTAAWMAGADTAPPAAAAPAMPPAVVAGTGGCGGGCGPTVSGCCDPCAKTGLLAKLKGKFGSKGHDCGCAPAPAPCDPCASARPNLLDTIKARMAAKKHHDCCTPACDPCGAAPATMTPVTPVTPPPKDMPKPKETPKETPKGGTGAAPGAAGTPSIPVPVTPIGGPKLNGTSSPY